MPLGASALPPKAYVEFCERKPQDCGDDPQLVLASARRAEADRAELLAELGPAMPPVIMPAALTARAPTTPAAAAWSPPPDELEPVEAPISLAVERVSIRTSVVFIDPSAERLTEEAESAPRMTPRFWSLLNAVNAQINGAIERRTDLANYGQEDFWNTPLEDGRHAGDCEDYVLEKERALVQAGVSRNALNIAVVTTRWGETHAVLLVTTSEGEYVLDNLSPWVVSWRQAPYHWVRRQVNGDPFNWVMVDERARTKPARLLIASSR